MKHKILLPLFLIIGSAQAQRDFLIVDLNSKTSQNAIVNVHLVEDNTSKAIYAFAEEQRVTYGFKYNQNKVLESELVSGGLKRKYKEIIGHAVAGNKVRLIQKNSKGSKYASILYDFDNGTTIESEYDLDMASQKFLQCYSHNETSYLFTLNRATNQIIKWRFSIDGTYKMDTINFDSEYKRLNTLALNFNDLLLESHGMKTFASIIKIDNRLPNNLEITSKTNKMYETKNGFTWTLDDNKNYTTLIDFTLPDLNPKIKFIYKPTDESDRYKSNSYIFEDKIAQIISNSSMLKIHVKDISSKKIIKSFGVFKDGNISFKNTPILQEGSTYSFGSTRKLEKTSKFLRKISSGKNGISIYSVANGYRAIIGGVRQQGGGAPMMTPGFGAMPIAQFGNMTMSFNPAAFAYGSYQSTGSTRIECLFDKNFIHVKGELSKNVFDKIDAYKENKAEHADNVFYLDHKVLFGNYYPSLKQYFLLEFK